MTKMRVWLAPSSHTNHSDGHTALGSPAVRDCADPRGEEDGCIALLVVDDEDEEEEGGAIGRGGVGVGRGEVQEGGEGRGHG